MFAIFLFGFINFVDATYIISVYGDVYRDVEFFTKTYPWIIDNIGGDLTVDYYLLGSGRYSVPQMCALNEIRLNTFLQAQFLKCEAEGRDSNKCLCDIGIDPQKFKQCVQTKGSLASFASSKYSHLGIEASPIVEIGPKNTIFEVDDRWYLKKICTIFGDNLPRGCIKPFSCNETSVFVRRSGLAVFDCTCTGFDELSTTEFPVTTMTSTTSGQYEDYSALRK